MANVQILDGAQATKYLGATGAGTDLDPFVTNTQTPAFISTNNSSTTPLGISGVFTGTSDQINGYGIIYVNVYSDQASATNGLSIQQSSDGTNWDHQDHFTIPAGTGKNFSINPCAQFMRIVYTNGAVAQTAFRLQVIFKCTGKSSSHRIQDPISSDDDAELVKSVLTGQGNGTFYNVHVNQDGAMSIFDNSNGLAIARSLVTGTVGVNKYGRSSNVDDGASTDIWDGANATNDVDIWQQPTAARIHSIVSTSASDTSTGVGAKQIRIYGLQTWASAESSELITMNGTTSVNTVNSYVIIHRMTVVDWGTSGPNVGKITATAATDSTKTAIILAGIGQTQMAIYGVPSTKTAYIKRFKFSILRSGLSTSEAHADLSLKVATKPDTIPNTYITKDTFGIGSRSNSPVSLPYEVPKKIPGPCIIKLNAIGSANNLDVSGSFDLVIVDNPV